MHTFHYDHLTKSVIFRWEEVQFVGTKQQQAQKSTQIAAIPTDYCLV